MKKKKLFVCMLTVLATAICAGMISCNKENTPSAVVEIQQESEVLNVPYGTTITATGSVLTVNGTEVTAEVLKEAGIISKTLDGVKILGRGEVTKSLTVKVAGFTASAKEKIEKGDFIKIFFAGLLVIAANQILVVQGMSYTSPVDAAVVCSTTPIFTLILATLILRERLTSFRLGGVALGFAAVVVFSLWGEPDVAMNVTNPVLGNAFCTSKNRSLLI